MKGSGTAREAPYFAQIGRGRIRAGLRSGGRDFVVSSSLARVNPKLWHHFAVAFSANQERLDLFIDGVFVRSALVDVERIVGNNLPLEIGRIGPDTGNTCSDSENSDVRGRDDCNDQQADNAQRLKGDDDDSGDEVVRARHWRGKLDDVRVWNIARVGADISSTFRNELTGTAPGLVGNWRFNEGSGATAADSSVPPSADATLSGGASFSTDVHP